MLTWILFTLSCLIVLFQYLKLKKEAKLNLPPGSWHFPILGHLPRLGTRPHEGLLKFRKWYGPVFTIQFGCYRTVIINDGDLIKKAMSMSAFSGRPILKFSDIFTKGRSGFASSDGSLAIHTRAFIQKNLKDFGYGGKSMESRLLEQLPSFLNHFEVHWEQQKSLHVNHAFGNYVISYLWSILMSKTVDPEDERFQEFATSISDSTKMTLASAAIFIPKLEEFLPFIFGFEEIGKKMDKIHRFIREETDKHGKSRVKDQPRDVADALLDLQEQRQDEPYNEWFVTVCIFELFGAGIETSSTLLEWILYYCVKYPETQQKLQAEIDAKIGQNRLPAFADRAEMPFTEALIQEAIRIVTPLPWGIFHRTVEDTTLEGFNIPKDTLVFPNFYGANHDPKVWGDPREFRPERFIDENGKFDRSQTVYSFGLGKRGCIGENLGRNQLFLYVVSLFQSYELKACGKLPNGDAILGITLGCRPFSVTVHSRNKG